ncbi:MAG: HAMP domain-containing histidine kinase [Deltaproteobacteria bacterium]|nr:HAMP domain-containing histidine kinase [Deltaproteobacteria bacterium]
MVMIESTGYQRGIRRLIRLRWIASAGVLGALAFATQSTDLVLTPALVVALLIPLSNLAHLILARKAFSARFLLLTQFVSDLVLLTALLGTLGGVDGPSIWLWLFHVLLAALLLERRDALVVSGLAITLMGGLATLQAIGAPFPIRGHAVYSAVLGISPALADSVPLILGQVVMLVVAVTVVLVLVIPIREESRDYEARLKDGEKKARDQAELLDNILDNMGAMMMVIDAEHRLTWVNRLVGAKFPAMAVGTVRRCYDPAEPMGGDAVPPCPSCYVLESEKPYVGDYTLATAGGESHVLRVYATPFRADETPKGLHAVELIVDVTAERKNEAALLEAQKTSAIARVTAGVAHELNTPLASLAAGLWSLERAIGKCGIAEGDERNRVTTLFRDLSEQTKRCQGVIESMLGFTRQARSRLDATEVDEVVRHALKDLATRRDISTVEVVMENAAPGLPAVRCDPEHVRLVLVGVLTNAVDAVLDAKRSKARVRIGVRSIPGSEWVEIHVIDNGLGISADVMDRIFEPFFTTKPIGKGAGLGLSVARGLLANMGGEISLRSDPGKGAEVIILLRADVLKPTDSTRADHRV